MNTQTSDELRDKCRNIQNSLMKTDAMWERQFGNKGGLYGLLKSQQLSLIERIEKEHKPCEIYTDNELNLASDQGFYTAMAALRKELHGQE